MKIALVSQEYPPETARGGIGSQTYNKAHGLTALGHEVTVLSRSIDSERHEQVIDGVRVVRIPGMEMELPEMTEAVQWITHSVAVAAELEYLHQKLNCDLVEFPEWGAEAYTFLLNRSEWKTIPTVIQLHGPLVMLAHTIGWPEKETAFYQTGFHMEATCVRLADAIYSSSVCSANWIQQHYKPDKEFIPTIHLGVDTTAFQPMPVAKAERLTIVFAGKIVPNKGVEELAEAAARLQPVFPGLQLRLLGLGQENYCRHLQQLATELGAPDLLQFAGFVDREQLPTEFSKAHLFAAPSWYEGGPGFVYLEAMACGLPVIGCSGSGVEEIVTPGVNGLLAPPQNSKALEEAMRNLLADEQHRKQLGVNARQYAVNEADTKACLKKLEAFYYSAIQKHEAAHANPLIHE